MERQEKKKKRKHLFGILLALLLGACSTEESTDNFPQGTIPIGFYGNIQETREVKEYTDAADLADIGVFAYFTNNDFNASTATPNFMYNQKVARANATSPWTYSPVKYWPANDKDKLSFFAYAPYADHTAASGSNPSFSGYTASGYPVLTYTVPSAEADQTDLLASTPMMNQTYKGTSGNVKFTMQHALTKVTLKIKSGDKYAKEITALSIHAATTGELHFKNDGFEWKNITGETDYAPSAATDLAFAATDGGKDVATFYLLPVGTVTATYSLTYKVKTDDGTEMLTNVITSAALPTSPLWQPGTSVSYTFNLYEHSATVTTETINEWTAGAAETTYTTYLASDLKAGDYYYSDGTTSDGGLRASSVGKDAVTGGQTSGTLVSDQYTYVTQSPVSGKTCVGIVFYVGQGEGDDAANYSSFGITKIDGYVVALSDCGGNINWGPTGDINGVNNAAPTTDLKFNGFTNTETVKKLSNYSSYTSFSKATGYGGVRPSTKASTWYLPSVAQLRRIYSSHYSTNGKTPKMLGQNIKKAGGVFMYSSRYWSSTPYSPAYACYVGFDGGDMATNQSKTDSRWFARSVLTFQCLTN